MFHKAVLCATAVLVVLAPAAWAQDTAEGDPYVLATMTDFNSGLRAEWMDLRAEWMDLRIGVEQIELLTLGQGRSSSRLHRQPFRWVAGDPRRAANGNGLTYLVDLSDGLGAELDPAATEAAVDRAMATWGRDSCLQKTALVKRPGGGGDPDIFDSRYGYGGFGDFRAADIVHAGWLPADFFERVTGPGGGQSVVAMSVTFIFLDLNGQPTDLDHDGYLDTAHTEIYYNRGFSWAAGAPSSPQQLDVETVALHEGGHALGIGHMGPPPTAVMNPVYAGVSRDLLPIDHAALCAVWSSWPQ